MRYKPVQCRTHGGTFNIPVKPGRQPVRCKPDNACTHAGPEAQYATSSSGRKVRIQPKGAEKLIKAAVGVKFQEADPGYELAHQGAERRLARKAGVVSSRAPKGTTVHAEEDMQKVVRRVKERQKAAPVTVETNLSIPMAHKAKQRLEPHGWTVSGRAWFSIEAVVPGREAQQKFGYAAVTAKRGEELITIEWKDGELINQTYQLWDDERPLLNEAPRNRLGFEPHDMPDAELIRRLIGQKVTWWNKLGQKEETAVVSAERVQIEHTFDRAGHEADRIIKFNAQKEGFRAFYVGALLKIG